MGKTGTEQAVFAWPLCDSTAEAEGSAAAQPRPEAPPTLSGGGARGKSSGRTHHATTVTPRRSLRVDPRRRESSAHAAGPRWLTADEATAYLSFPTRKALYAAVERGQVPAHRLGRRLRFRHDELDALLGRAR